MLNYYIILPFLPPLAKSEATNEGINSGHLVTITDKSLWDSNRQTTQTNVLCSDIIFHLTKNVTKNPTDKKRFTYVHSYTVRTYKGLSGSLAGVQSHALNVNYQIRAHPVPDRGSLNSRPSESLQSAVTRLISHTAAWREWDATVPVHILSNL